MLQTHFDNPSLKFGSIGRGLCRVKDGALITRNAYATFGDRSWRNYEVDFTAVTPSSEKKVEIWAGFRAANRDDRYVVALKGGIQNDLYLARLGYMGADDFLALRHLDFPLETGKPYRLRIQVAGSRIRIFVNGERLPRIDVTDKNAFLDPAGKITLGGGWLLTRYTYLSIRSLDSGVLRGMPAEEYAPASADKEKERRLERAAYRPVKVPAAGACREEISLDGRWLFKPGYQVASEQQAVSPRSDDRDWHVLGVPAFWNPTRIWLFGERYGTASKGTSDSYYQKEIDRCAAYTFDYKKTAVGWYRQWIDLPPDISGKHLMLHFDAVSKTAEVWVNGHKAGSHIGMFGDFGVDVTALMKPGRNLVAVKVYRDYVKNTPDANKIIGVAVSEEVTQKMLRDLPHGFYDDDPAGIWQPVSLVITNPVKITDVFIKPGLHGATFQVTVKNHARITRTLSLSTTIVSCQSTDTLYRGPSVKRLSLKAGEQRTVTYSVDGLHPALWSPEHPNLYDFRFVLKDAAVNRIVDNKIVRSGFKTFTVKDGYFYLNGRRYWLRGANQTVMPIAPNDTALAARFCQLMHDGHIMVTRTHTAPYDELWMNASDQYGVGVSYEGTWPWLMLGDTPIPDTALLTIWKNEFYDLIRKYRNHPSLMIWTVGNELNFYADDPDKARAEQKMKIISEVVKHMREIDPTHPICFASNYSRKQTERRFGKAFMDGIDDGDIDDIHYYPNWYNNSIFQDFNGQFQQDHKYPGRPLISQELSTGYPDETGHPTRFYTFVHQTPQALIGKYAYAYNDPEYFLRTNAFITKEEAEALRRTNPQAAGILHFSLATWFANIYLPKKIRPFPVYYAMEKALQPVLVSAELWGRHFYAGTRLPVRICVVNDQADGSSLPATTLSWQLVSSDGIVFASGDQPFPPVKYYGRQWITPQIMIPAKLPRQKTRGKLILTLSRQGRVISRNDYRLLFATSGWAAGSLHVGSDVVVADPSGKIFPVFDFLHLPYRKASSVEDALSRQAAVYVFSRIDTASAKQVSQIRSLMAGGAKILLLNATGLAAQLFPQYIRGEVTANRQIATMDVPESPVFTDIAPLETRYFNDNQREVPAACGGAYQINRDPHVLTLASSEMVHGYLQGSIERRSRFLDRIKGFPLVEIKGQKGTAIVSSMLLDKGTTDPVAGRLLSNLLTTLLK